MKKLTALLLAMILCLASLTACGEEDGESGDLGAVKDAKKMIIGVTEYDPMNYKDGDTWVGFDTEYAEAVCKKLGIKAEFQVIDWEKKEALLKAGNIDCIWNGLTVTAERKENMDFSTTYLMNKQVVVINKKDADKFTSTESLAGAMLSAEIESAGETAIKEDANLSKASYTASEKQMDALTQLLAGNYDAVVLDYTLAKANCGQGDFADLMIVDSIKLTDEEYAIGFRTGSNLTAEINKITAELVKDGTLKKIAEKYDLVELYDEANK